MYKDLEINSLNMNDFLIKLMECVEEIPLLIGEDKKKIVKGVLIVIVEKLHIKQEEKDKIIYLLTNDIIDIIIDLIVKLTKIETSINKNIVKTIEMSGYRHCALL